jgi:serine protease Do
LFLISLALTCAFGQASHADLSADSIVGVVRDVRPKMVKIYGAGGLRGLEAYQSGMLISPEGHVLTAWSYVLDTDEPTVVLDDGRRFNAELIAADPLTEIALLKLDPGDDSLPCFTLADAVPAETGMRVLAFSNLFGIATGNEPVSVLQGYVAAVAPLEARRGAFSTTYRGDVCIVDAATNNPGAAGGALTDANGRLVGMLGKELRSELTGTWLNYALPIAAFAPTAEAMIAGDFTPADLNEADRPEKPLTLAALGIALVPDVVTRTPPFIDRVLPDSSAALAGLRPDDLLVMLDSQVVASCHQVTAALERYDHDTTIRLGVLRDEALLEFTLQPVGGEPTMEE